MINRIILVGRLTRDPELRRTNSGLSVATFTIASDMRGRQADGQKTTLFITCTCWNTTADNVAKFTHKGSLVAVDGRLTQRTFERRDGGKQTVNEIICESVQFLEPRSQEEANAAGIDDIAGYAPDPETNDDPIDVTNDDLPF